jgi:hypothetical protein
VGAVVAKSRQQAAGTTRPFTPERKSRIDAEVKVLAEESQPRKARGLTAGSDGRPARRQAGRKR